jgi:group I intron endonuclease
MTYYLYKITNLINGKKYIGVTRNPKRRWIDHKTKTSKTYLSRGIHKYGWINFEFQILVIGDEAYIKELEVKAIVAFNTKAPNGYNLTDGGEGVVGWSHSDETRRLISLANTLRKHSNATKEKLRQSALGRKISIKQRMQQSKSVIIDGSIYWSVKEAALSLQIPQTTLRRRLRNVKYPTHQYKGEL